MFGNTPPPSTSVDVCMYDGFGLNSGVTIRDGNGALLFNGEAFEWRPWEAKGEMRLINDKGQFEVPAESLAVLDLLWPRPGSSTACLLNKSGRSALPFQDSWLTVLLQIYSSLVSERISCR
jgi:hypothetical protein